MSPATTKSVFFDTEPLTLPPAPARDAVAPSREQPSQRAGDDDGDARRAVAGPASAPLVRQCARRPRATCSTISRCQSTANHSTTDSAMVGPTPSTAARSSTRRRWRRCAVEAAELAGQCLRGGRADVPDRQRDEHPPQRPVLGRLEVGRAACSAFAVSSRAFAVAFASEERAAQQGRPRRGAKTSPSSLHQPATRAARPPPCTRGPRCRSAPRPATWKTRSRSCAGQERVLGQRMSTSPSFAGASGVPHSGQSGRHDERALGAVAQLDDRADAPRG